VAESGAATGARRPSLVREMSAPSSQERSRSSTIQALLVGAGMLLSRISGFLRQTLFTSVLGLGDAADAFTAAVRIPNFLQNLLGEGVLSASLIPVYSGLLQKAQQKDADRVARAVLGLLTLVTAVVVLLGMTFTPQVARLTGCLYTGEKFDLTVRLVRILFPGIGLLVFSAWCLAILNSHHKFFLAYVAPVLWNAAMIGALVIYRADDLASVAVHLAWAAVIGSALQFGVQVPSVWRIMAPEWTETRHALDHHVRRVVTTSIPVFFSRGAVQISALIDTAIASVLPAGALAALGAATQLYQLPVGLFGMGVSSAALPSMSAAAADNVVDLLRERLLGGQRAIAVLVIPSMMAFLGFGDLIINLLFQHGRFSAHDTTFVWGVLAGSAVGLLATTVGRLYSAAFFALGDTATPMRCALVRVAVVGILGYLFAIKLPPMLHIDMQWGTAGLTASAGLAGWIEFSLLRRALTRRIGGVGIPFSFLAKGWGAACVMAVPATALRWVISPHWMVTRDLVILTTFGGSYLIVGHFLGLLDINDVRGMITRRRRAPAR
jgi:putative peptidoglycan lipid II flippase